ncbi:unnamed protein product, partial [Rotaria sp. Silwood2]
TIQTQLSRNMAEIFKKKFDPVKSRVKSFYSNSPLGLVFDMGESKTGVDSSIIAMGIFSIILF